MTQTFAAQSLRVHDYGYQLSAELIAQEPAAPRDSARLLVVDQRNDHRSHAVVRDLELLLRPADVLVANRTRVLPARFRGRRRGTWHLTDQEAHRSR